jgi:hypothetical protein
MHEWKFSNECVSKLYRHAKNKGDLCTAWDSQQILRQEELFSSGFTTQPPGMEAKTAAICILRDETILPVCRPWGPGLTHVSKLIDGSVPKLESFP